MNFFGHAAIATWTTVAVARAPLVLGAMLPDFASMCGVRLGDAGGDAIARGIALHHRTDAVFHRLAGFIRLCRAAEGALQAAGVRRGPARGIAHIGVEILLDRAMLDDAAVRAAYVDALACGAPELRGAEIDWREPEGAPRFEHLRRRLEAHGVPDDYRDLGAVAHRLTRALAGRPLLALDGADREGLARTLPAVAAQVGDASPAIIDALRGALLA